MRHGLRRMLVGVATMAIVAQCLQNNRSCSRCDESCMGTSLPPPGQSHSCLPGKGNVDPPIDWSSPLHNTSASFLLGGVWANQPSHVHQVNSKMQGCDGFLNCLLAGMIGDQHHQPHAKPTEVMSKCTQLERIFCVI